MVCQKPREIKLVINGKDYSNMLSSITFDNSVDEIDVNIELTHGATMPVIKHVPQKGFLDDRKTVESE